MPFTVIFSVVNGKRPSRPSQEDCRPRMSDIMWRLIEDAWSQDPAARPSMLQLEERLRLGNDVDRLGRRASSPTTRYRLSHRELVRLSIPQAKAPDDGPPTPPRVSVATFNLPNISVHSLLQSTPVLEPQTGADSDPPLPSTLWMTFGELEQGYESQVIVSKNEPTLPEGARAKPTVPNLEGRKKVVSGSIPPTLNESRIARRNQGPPKTSVSTSCTRYTCAI
jgi:hypothetical protein